MIVQSTRYKYLYLLSPVAQNPRSVLPHVFLALIADKEAVDATDAVAEDRTTRQAAAALSLRPRK